MIVTRWIALIGLGASVSACAVVDVPSRNTPFEDTAQQSQSATPLQAGKTATDADEMTTAPVSVEAVTVRVPRSLRVSESNSFLPAGDIVWRGDPIGDRHAQVQTIVQTALERGVAPLDGKVPVDLDVEVMRFHALTEKARYTTGGTHAITFKLTVTSTETGAVLMPTRRIRADLPAFGGQQALNAEMRGQTQKVRITNHLAEVIRQELTQPEGYRNATLGFYQLLNQL